MIYLATDHRGFELKEKIKGWLTEWGYDWEDLGAFEYNPDDDYPDFIHRAGKKVSENPDALAIILGGSGQGEAMVANRYKSVRAIVYDGGSEEKVIIGRLHNNANILSIGAAPGKDTDSSKQLDPDLVKNAIKLWLETPFSGEEKHLRRINKIDKAT